MITADLFKIRRELIDIALVNDPSKRAELLLKWWNHHVLAFSQQHTTSRLLIEKGKVDQAKLKKNIKYELYHRIAEMMMDKNIGMLEEHYENAGNIFGSDRTEKLEIWVIR